VRREKKEKKTGEGRNASGHPSAPREGKKKREKRRGHESILSRSERERRGTRKKSVATSLRALDLGGEREKNRRRKKKKKKNRRGKKGKKKREDFCAPYRQQKEKKRGGVFLYPFRREKKEKRERDFSVPPHRPKKKESDD